MKRKFKFVVQRFDPTKDDKPYFQTYEVEIEPWKTVLDGIRQIRETMDTTLAFRMSCKSGICGSCTMRINRRARLACKLKIENEIAKFGEIRIEPIGNLKIQKDLACDMQPFFAEMIKVKPWFDSILKTESLMHPSEVKKIEKSSECIWCGACFSDCPSREFNKKYLGPAAAVLAHRYIFDVRDKRKKARLIQVMKSNIWMCAHCERSTGNCPQNIEPQEIISALRGELIKEGITNHDGARHAKTITKSVKKSGELSEFWLPIGTFGIFRVIKEMPTAIKLFFKRKLPPIFMKKIKNHDQVTQLHNDVQRDHNEEMVNEMRTRQKMEDLERKIKKS